MKRSTTFLGLIAVAAGAGAAHAAGGAAGPGGPPKGPSPAMLLVMAADADRSHDVTAAEWSAFLASLNADANGVVDLTALAAALPPAPADAPADGLTRLFDVDRDGSVTLGDLGAIFSHLDSDGDGALSSAELAPPAPPEGGGHDGPPPQGGPGGHDHAPPCDAKKGAMLLARAADADQSHDVSSDEWTAFIAQLDPDGDGVVDLSALAALLPAPPHGAHGDPAAMLTRALDQDQDGTVTVTDLAAVFALLDPNGDGAASMGEVKSQARKVMKGGAKKGAMGLLRAADADADKSVSGEEWAAFLDGIATDESGAVSLDALAEAIHAPAPKDGDTTKRDAMLTKVFDQDADGVVTKADLQAVFNFFDRNADGAVDRSEVRPHR